MRSTFSILACVLLTACAGRTALLPDIDNLLAIAEVEKQHEIFLTDYRDHLVLASTVFAELARANADYCPKAGALYTGMLATNAGGFPAAQRVAARKVFGDVEGANDIDDQPWVFSIIPNSPAADAGLAVGDRVLAVAGQDIGNGTRGQTEMMSAFRTAAGAGPVAITVKRGTEKLSFAVTPEPACDYGFALRRSERINAFADGSRVEVTTGLLRFVKTPDELALIVGHELAHNVLGHRDSATQNAVTGGLIGASGALLAAGPLGAVVGLGLAVQGATYGARANSQDYESEADYVGTYYAARAGYNVENAADVIRRFAVLDPGAIHLRGGTHPSTALRFLAIEETAREIRNKQVAGSAVVPNVRD